MPLRVGVVVEVRAGTVTNSYNSHLQINLWLVFQTLLYLSIKASPVDLLVDFGYTPSRYDTENQNGISKSI